VRSATASSLKLKPADPFDLIRCPARSQSDPRKAVAELVQNSVDATRGGSRSSAAASAGRRP
jgi:hypothetical protein